MYRAREEGYTSDDPAWSNLGQGSPETGPLPGIFEQTESCEIKNKREEYAPMPGFETLRQNIADFYNIIHRQNKSSKYTYENVSIAPGGRAALTRIAASISNINIGHFIPDYTAYEELLSIFRAFIPIPTPLDSNLNYQISPLELKREILSHGLSAILLSNPCNPTGKLVEGEMLKHWVSIARDLQCSFIFDEFYSHFIFTGPKDKAKIVSAAEFVEDVENDPVVIVDGLTKNWRLPGWRIGWIIGPRKVIDAVSSAGSFLDGGANNPLQTEAACLLEPETVLHNAKILQEQFRIKRDLMLEKLKDIGIVIDVIPSGTFYLWANLSSLPPPINRGDVFFEECLKEKTIIVPGVFFDVNPDKRRVYSRWENYIRLSFGPGIEEVKQGLDAIERVVRRHKQPGRLAS